MNQPDSKVSEPKTKVPGLKINTKLMLAFLGYIFLLGILLVFLYQRFVPPLVNEQIVQRTFAISKSFSSTVLEPVLTRNYLRVNKVAEITVNLPDVAYVAVINKRGIAIAGQFSDLSRFTSDFAALVKEKGFPKKLVEKIRMTTNQTEEHRDIVVGGQKVFEIAMPLGLSGSEAHIGIFTENVDKELQAALYPLLALLGIMGLVGAVAIMLVAKTVSQPIRQLTEQAHAISIGKIDTSINIKCGGEIWELAQSFTRMQAAVNYMMKKMQHNEQRSKTSPQKSGLNSGEKL